MNQAPAASLPVRVKEEQEGAFPPGDVPDSQDTTAERLAAFRARALSPRPGSLLLLLAIVAGLALLIRSAGVFPTVFSDEFVHSAHARLLPFREASMPGYLYALVYGWTSYCGTGFLTCARIQNILFFVMAAPFLYATCRRVAGQKTSLLVTAIAILGPLNIYTTFFMPEAPYFFCFWLFTWLLLGPGLQASWLHAVGAGLVLGCSTLVKPHALFLFPSVAVYLMFARTDAAPATAQQRISTGVLLLGTAALVKALGGLALAGPAGLTLFGQVYGSQASGATAGLEKVLSVLTQAALSAPAHALALVALFGVGVASIPVALRAPRGASQYNLALYALMAIAPLVAVSIVYTAGIAGMDPTQTMQRVHMRYYNFALPLLVMVAAMQMRDPADARSATRRLRLVVGAAVCASLIYVAYQALRPSPVWIDAPELWALTSSRGMYLALLACALLAAGWWMHSARAGARVFLFVFLPAFTCWSIVPLSGELAARKTPDAVDRAGAVARGLLTAGERSKLLVVAADGAEAYRALFYIDHPKASFQLLDAGKPFLYSQVPAGVEWVLALRSRSLPEEAQFQLGGDDYTLARVGKGQSVEFAKGWSGTLSAVEGISEAAPGGAWSLGERVVLSFARPLPRRFRATLHAQGFGPNAGKAFRIVAGESRHDIVLDAAPAEHSFEVANASGSRELRIDVPMPTSPKSVGMSNDERRLGLRLIRLDIVPVAE